MELIEQAKEKFEKVLDYFKEEITGIRTNRPTPKLIEDIQVDYFEQKMPIKQLGSITVEAPRDLLVSVWDENAVSSVQNAIEAANLGVNVSQQGKIVRAKLPDLTEERKTELVKIVKSMAEESRIKMRQERDEINKAIKEVKDEDDQFRAKEKLQELVDKFNSQVDEIVEKKNQEIFE